MATDLKDRQLLDELWTAFHEAREDLAKKGGDWEEARRAYSRAQSEVDAARKQFAKISRAMMIAIERAHPASREPLLKVEELVKVAEQLIRQENQGATDGTAI